MACCVMKNVLCIKSQWADIQLADQEDRVTHAIVEGTWRQDAALLDVDAVFTLDEFSSASQTTEMFSYRLCEL